MGLQKEMVDRLFSTRPIDVVLRDSRYSIPVNYFSPMPDESFNRLDATKHGYFGFFLFLPRFGGYTKENWIDPLDTRKISVIEVSPKDRSLREVDPTSESTSKTRFEMSKWRLEEVPSVKAFGLEGYRRKFMTVDIEWTGTRSNGEFIFFKCNLAPGDPPQIGMPNPLCDVRYYSEKEQLFVVYRYSNNHLPKWREIDDAVWAKLREWRIK